MQIHKNIFDNEMIHWLRDLGVSQAHRFEKKKDYGQDVRIQFGPECAGFHEFRDLVWNLFPETPRTMTCIYERQYDPTPLHVDPEPMAYTMIIPLHHDPRVQTLAWTPKFDTVDAWHRFVIDWQPNDLVSTRLSETEHLSHCYDVNKECNMADYLELDDIFEYRLGDACVFSARQVHCSSDWRELGEYEFKDFAVVHVYT